MANGLLARKGAPMPPKKRAAAPAPQDDGDPEDQQDGGADEATEDQQGGQQQPDAEDQQDQGSDEDQEGQPATAAEQEQYNLFVGQCLKVIYDNGRVQPAILQRLAVGKPVDALARVASDVVSRVTASAQSAGHPLETDVIFHGGKEVLEDIADIARIAKIHDYTQDELDGAWYAAIDLYRAEHSKQIDQGQAKQELGALQQASQSGQLGRVLPGLDKFAAQAAPQGQDQGQDQGQGGQQQEAA